MPELPEVEVLCRRLDERCLGRTVSRVELASIAALKSYAPPLGDLVGAEWLACSRRGKYVCIELRRASAEQAWLVINLARAGWVKWRPKLSVTTGRPGRGPLALRVGFDEGDGFEVTEMGHEKRLSIWTTAPSTIDGVSSLGPEPLDPDLTVELLGKILSAEKGDLKHALSRQSLIAGVGNAYSDEALNAARLSPYKPCANLSREELGALHEALTGVLRDAITRSEGLDLDELKDGKRSGMRVHGRTGLPCGTCGDTVREVSFATRSMQYCPTCQTGGKPLADRRLSRLLK
ncbi:MAG: DNA-formamidopyrimidine glycosylase family protein [Acidimicrobiales bacterium]